MSEQEKIANVALHQRADLMAELDQLRETCVKQGELIDRLHDEIAELRRRKALDEPVTAAAQANAKEIVSLVSEVTGDLHADICAENDNLQADNARLRKLVETLEDERRGERP